MEGRRRRSPQRRARTVGHRLSRKTLERLTEAEPVGDPVWTSSFSISHRAAESFSSGAVVLAGDAAHGHSPIGARGMNLGIEDARVIAQLAAAGRIVEYDRGRRPFDEPVVRRVKRVTDVVAGRTAPRRPARRMLLPIVARVRPVRGAMLEMLTGLDHALA